MGAFGVGRVLQWDLKGEAGPRHSGSDFCSVVSHHWLPFEFLSSPVGLDGQELAEFSLGHLLKV